MKVKLLFIGIIFLAMCLFLTGCGEKNADKTVSENNNNLEQQDIQKSEEKVNPEIKIAKVWMKLPKNVNMHWKTDEKGTSNYQLKFEFKRDNNVMSYSESLENGVYTSINKDGIANDYYYYHYQGDYIWTSYCYFSTKGWDNWYFKGVYPASPQCYCFGKPWNILDEYSDNYETVNIEGVGEVDTVIGTDEDGYTYYYSKDLGFNVKIENNVQIWHLIKFDTNVSTGFPYDLPDMKTLDAKRESNNSDETNIDDNSQKVVEDDDGELIIYDE